MLQKINKVIEMRREATSKGFVRGCNQGQASEAERGKVRKERKEGQREQVIMKERGMKGGRSGGRGWRVRPLHDNSFIRKDLDQEFSLYITIS